MAEHTPGPWYVIPLPWDETACCITSKDPDPHLGEFVCDASHFFHDYADKDIKRWQANARLIASAPDLLAACILAREKISGIEDVFDELVIELDTAIAKATGEGD